MQNASALSPEYLPGANSKAIFIGRYDTIFIKMKKLKSGTLFPSVSLEGEPMGLPLTSGALTGEKSVVFDTIHLGSLAADEKRNP